MCSGRFVIPSTSLTQRVKRVTATQVNDETETTMCVRFRFKESIGTHRIWEKKRNKKVVRFSFISMKSAWIISKHIRIELNRLTRHGVHRQPKIIWREMILRWSCKSKGSQKQFTVSLVHSVLAKVHPWHRGIKICLIVCQMKLSLKLHAIETRSMDVHLESSISTKGS